MGGHVRDVIIIDFAISNCHHINHEQKVEDFLANIYLYNMPVSLAFHFHIPASAMNLGHWGHFISIVCTYIQNTGFAFSLLMIRYFLCASFKQFSLSFPDVNKNKGVAETAPLTLTKSIAVQKGLANQSIELLRILHTSWKVEG